MDKPVKGYLYLRHGCGACDKVSEMVDQRKLPVEKRYIEQESTWSDEVFTNTGHRDFPCLNIREPTNRFVCDQDQIMAELDKLHSCSPAPCTTCGK